MKRNILQEFTASRLRRPALFFPIGLVRFCVTEGGHEGSDPLNWFVRRSNYELLLVSTLFSLFSGTTAQRGPGPPHSLKFVDHTQLHSTVGRTSLDEGSARRRDLYLTAHNTHSTQTSMPSAGLEPAIPASDRAVDTC